MTDSSELHLPLTRLVLMRDGLDCVLGAIVREYERIGKARDDASERRSAELQVLCDAANAHPRSEEAGQAFEDAVADQNVVPSATEEMARRLLEVSIDTSNGTSHPAFLIQAETRINAALYLIAQSVQPMLKRAGDPAALERVRELIAALRSVEVAVGEVAAIVQVPNASASSVELETARKALKACFLSVEPLLAEVWPEPPAAALTPEKPPTTPRSPFQFKQIGDLWEVIYEGQRGLFPGISGMRYIAELLALPNPRSGIPSIHLARPPRDLQSSPHTDQGVSDDQALSKYREEMAEIEKDLAEADQSKDEPKQKALQVRRTALLDAMKGSNGFGYRMRLMDSNPAESARSSVWAALQVVYKKLRGGQPPMISAAEHLERSISVRSGMWWYEPAKPPPSWDL